MRTSIIPSADKSPTRHVCAMCGIPADSEVFDESSIVDAPSPGQAIVLAHFQLAPQYCGVLQYFVQYTDLQAKQPEEVRTPGLQWTVRSNNHPLYPYIQLDRILNPWGYGSYQVAIRLDEASVIDLVVRNVATDTAGVSQVGGRLMGRYWYNTAYGGVA